MPNWMKGTLRVRGTWKGVRRFLINALEPLGDAMSIRINEGSVSGAGGPYHCRQISITELSENTDGKIWIGISF